MIKNFTYKKLFPLIAVATIFMTCYGQVGINTTNPQGVFNIDGNKNNPIKNIPNEFQQTDDFVVLSDGKTGIGTTSPTHQLHVKAETNPLRAEGLVSGLKSDSIVVVDPSTGVFRLKSLSSIVGGNNTTSTICNPTISGGNIAHNQPYGCSNYNPGAFISDPVDPGIGGPPFYTWQESTDGGNTWTTALGASNDLNYDPPALTVATKYRRAAINICGSIYSNEVTIAIDGLTSGIKASPCATSAGNNIALSVGLDTGATVLSWTASSTELSFTSNTSANTNLIVPKGIAEGLYTVTVTVSSSCGIKSFTTSIKVIPPGNNVLSLKRSCKEILLAGLSKGNGLYWIDPDGSGNAYCAEEVYCNMLDNGGGWTLILKSMDDNSDFHYSSPIWASGIPFNNNDYEISDTSKSNALYPPYNYLQTKEFWVDFVTTPDLTSFTLPKLGTPKALANSGLNVNIANQYLNQPLQTSGMNPLFFTPSNAYSYQTGAVGNGVNLGSTAPGFGGGATRFGVLFNDQNNELFNTADSAVGIGVYRINGGTVSFGSGNSVVSGNLPGQYGVGFYKALLWAR